MYTLAIKAFREKDADCYYYRAHCYREIEMFINATEDLQSACDLRPYPQASISSETLYATMKKYLQTCGIDFD